MQMKNLTQAAYKYSPLMDFSHSYLNFLISCTYLNPVPADFLVLIHD